MGADASMRNWEARNNMSVIGLNLGPEKAPTLATQNRAKVNLSDLTFRQYMALTLILSTLKVRNRYPTKGEIKEAIQMQTDRMLEVTLRALDKKGLIHFKGLEVDPIVEVPEANSGLFLTLVDKLMLADNFVTYPEIQRKIFQEALLRDIKPPLASSRRMALADKDLADRLRQLNGQKGIVHRWYTLLQDFPPSLVWDKLVGYGIRQGHIVLDPFCGSGTTLVTSKMMGVSSIGIDVNPVAHFATSAKCRWEVNLQNFKEAAEQVLRDFYYASSYLSEVRLRTDLTEKMTQVELNQWLKTNTQNEVGYLRERIKEVKEDPVRQLLQLALVSAAVESSNVAFCPGTTFYPFRKRDPFSRVLEAKLTAIYEDIQDLQQIEFSYGKTDVLCADCRKLSGLLNREIDFIFTSPPYPNDLEYTRQTRLELYLLDFVQNMQDVQKIKREMVKGSTKLIFDDSNSADLVRKFLSIQEIADAVEGALKGKKWGWDYPRMIREYFGDMYLVLAEMHKVLKRSGWALLVVGDQTCKGVLIPVGSILCELAIHLNFSQVRLETLRIRRSTAHTKPLKEEIVILKK
jgi:hypothetical protein